MSYYTVNKPSTTYYIPSIFAVKTWKALAVQDIRTWAKLKKLGLTTWRKLAESDVVTMYYEVRL